MTTETNDRATRRARERNDRDRARRIRGLALRTMATLAEQDTTTSGFTLIMPNGTVEYLGAEILRRGGNA
jgi:hypothetical protein